MGKPFVEMRNWELFVSNEKYILSGTADNYPNFGRNVYISRTSSLVAHSFKDDVLTYEARNTKYICPLKYITPEPYGDVIPDYKEELLHRADNSESYLDKIIAAIARIALKRELDDGFVKRIIELSEQGQKELKELEEKENARLCSIAKEYKDSIYLEVSNVDRGDKLAYHFGDCLGVLEPKVHTGMFQDSVLYMKHGHKENDCRFDFRYFPRGAGSVMNTYSWSDNIKSVVIKNVTDIAIGFNGDVIREEETKVFYIDTHIQGLISPDCYNGKSVLFSSNDEEK